MGLEKQGIVLEHLLQCVALVQCAVNSHWKRCPDDSDGNGHSVFQRNEKGTE